MIDISEHIKYNLAFKILQIICFIKKIDKFKIKDDIVLYNKI